MKRLQLLFTGLALLSPVFLTVPALAQNTPTNNDEINAACAAAPDSAFCRDRNRANGVLVGQNSVFRRTAQFIAVITGMVSLFIIAIAGMRFIMSQGDTQKVASARAALIYASIGLVVAAISQIIATFILNQA